MHSATGMGSLPGVQTNAMRLIWRTSEMVRCRGVHDTGISTGPMKIPWEWEA